MLLLTFVLTGLSQPACAQQTIFTNQTPVLTGASDGRALELGMKFQSSAEGTISAIRYWKDGNELAGNHVGQIWSSTGVSLANTTFQNETASGWQQQALSSPLHISANTTYVVSVNINSFYVDSVGPACYPCAGLSLGLYFPISNGALTSIADDHNGVFGTSGVFPTNSYKFSNYFRDVVFTPDQPNPPQPAGCFEKLVSVDGGNAFAAYTSLSRPAVALAGTPVEFKFVVTNCGDVSLTPKTVDDCINADPNAVPFACAPTSAFGQGAAGLVLYEPPTAAPTPNLLWPGSSVTYSKTELPKLLVSATDVATLCQTASLIGQSVVRNDSEFDATDVNNSSVSYEADAYVQCPGPPPTASCVVINAVQGVPITPVTMTGSGGAGGPYNFSATGLPAGLSVASNGTISGTPTVSGTFPYTVTVTDSAGNKGTFNCSVTVNPPPLTLTCPAGIAVVGVPYSSSLVASGGLPPYTFSITSGALPTGLTLDPATGAITGTPASFGTYSFTAKVVDSRGNAAGTTTSTCTITVAPSPVVLICAANSATEGQAYSSSLQASGGVAPYTFSITSGALPTGLTLNPQTGAITGTPASFGTYSFTAKVVDATGTAAGTAVNTCTITIAPPCTIPASSEKISATSWNKFNAPAGSVVWVHAQYNPKGVSTTTKTTVRFTGVFFVLNGANYPMPDGVMTFDPAAPATSSTHFNAALNQWETLINPKNLSDENFMTGAAIPVDANIMGGGQATITFTTKTDDTGLNFPWQWSAAVYTYWPADWNQAQIQPYHGNGLHADTPLNTMVQHALVQGPRGGGGSNYTGSWSATGNGACPAK